jgi:succinate dehydrogenase/fumarate reductase cytochrome b subunit
LLNSTLESQNESYGMLYIGLYHGFLGFRRLVMKVKRPDSEHQDITLAGLLVISLFSMCIGILVGVFVST